MTSCETKPTLVLYTGGTFGMKVNGEGLKPVEKFTVSDELETIVSLSDRKKADEISRKFGDAVLQMRSFTTRKTKTVDREPIKYHFYELDTLIDSSLMNEDNWKEIATLIKGFYDDYSGFVVVMGTDTMAYASSALSFMLENLGKPVVFTGAQIPIFDGRSDGPENLMCSLIVSTLGIPEVLLCFNKKAFRGNRVVKTDCVDLDAYDSPNLPPLVTLDSKVTETESLERKPGNLQVQEMCPKGQVGLLVIYPGITEEQVRNTVKALHAVVVLTFGSGNIDDKIVNVLGDEQLKRKRLYANVTQCLKGAVTSDYNASKALERLGAVNCSDITTEAAFTKLSYVLAKKGTFEERKQMMETVLRGEMSAEDRVKKNRNIENN
ncbi:L-asparaginase 1-like isoform X2 [Haliotis asinina]|uniref:L-asparaginase 1-like isoform X2 n=2 Tax=Haliotis asinina TaxID=109174 RepID=UPI0035319C99